MDDSPVLIRPVGVGQISELAGLFDRSRNTKRCWCMAPCSTRANFAVGWMTGSNRRRFAAMAAASDAPMGVLASVGTQPIGWCACGPRSRYLAAGSSGADVLPQGDSSEDETVWLVPCFVVRPEHRSRGVGHALLRGAVDVATHCGATAIDGRPAEGSDPPAGELFRGRESLFADLGFADHGERRGGRVTMRLHLR